MYINTLVKNAQILISKEQGEIKNKIKEEINKLEEWSKANGKTLKESYLTKIR